MPTQHNSPIYINHHPLVDAGCILTLRAAGALIFGEFECDHVIEGGIEFDYQVRHAPLSLQQP